MSAIPSEQIIAGARVLKLHLGDNGFDAVLRYSSVSSWDCLPEMVIWMRHWSHTCHTWVIYTECFAERPFQAVYLHPGMENSTKLQRRESMSEDAIQALDAMFL